MRRRASAPAAFGAAIAVVLAGVLVGCEQIAGYDGARARPAPPGDGAATGGPSACKPAGLPPPLGTDQSPLTVARVPGPLRVDGEEEAAWCASLHHPIATRVGSTSAGAAKGTFRAVYDQEALYLLIEAMDERPFGRAFFYYENDGIDVALDVNASRSSAFEADDAYIATAVDSRELHRPENAPDRPLPGVEFKSVPVPRGMRWELRIPWTDLGVASPSPGKPLGIEVQIRDTADGKTVERFRWYSGANDGMRRPANWGRARLE